MRTLTIAVAALVAAGTPVIAAAQAGNTAGMVNLPGVAPKETSPLKRLPKPARDWIAAEKTRLAAEPRPLEELVFEIQYALDKDILKVAERERLDTHDLIMVILFDLTSGAREAVKAELNDLDRARAPETARVAAAGRKAQLDAIVAEVVQGQSVLARQLSGNL